MEQIQKALTIPGGLTVKQRVDLPALAKMEPEQGISTTDSSEIRHRKTISKGKPRHSDSKKTSNAQKTFDNKLSSNPVINGAPAALSIESFSGTEPPDDISLAIRRNTREILCRQLAEFSRKLVGNEYSDEEFSRMSLTLSRLATQERDFLVKNIATALVVDWVEWNDPVSDWMMKAGSVEGPSMFLKKIEERISEPQRQFYVSEENDIPGFLRELWENTKGRPVPEKTLRVVSHLAHDFLKRAEVPLDKQIREKEPAESDRDYASNCLFLLHDWWGKGQIKIIKDSVLLMPGSAEIEDIIYNEKVSVSGSSIVLSTGERITKALRKDLEKILESIGTGNAGKKGLEMLEDLSRKDHKKAEKVIKILVSDASPAVKNNERVIQRLDYLIESSKDRPWLKDLLKPCTGRMLEYVHEAEMRGIISNDGCSLRAVDIYAGFIQRIVESFPEALNQGFVQNTLRPLLLADAHDSDKSIRNLVSYLWDKKPELVGPTLGLVLDSNDSCLRSYHWELLSHAAKDKGWTPGVDQLEILAAQIYAIPRRREKDHPDTLYMGATKDSGFVKGMRLVKALSEKNPEILEKMRLPDNSGAMTPIKRYVLDRLISDPGGMDAARALYTGGSTPDWWGFVKPLYASLFPDDRLTGELLDTLEQSYREAGSLGKMDSRAQNAFAVLASQNLPDSQASRLKDIMLKDRYNRQGFYVLSDEVNKVRQQEIERELKILSSRELSTSKVFETVMDILEISSATGISSDYERHSEITITTMAENLKSKVGTQEFTTAASKLLADFRRCYREKGTIEAMGHEGLAQFQILERLSREEVHLFGRLFDLFKSDLTKDQGYGNGVTLALFDRFRRRQMDINLERLRSSPLPQKERFDRMEENFAIGKASYHFRDLLVRKENLDAFRENLRLCPPSTGLPEMAELLKDSEHVHTLHKSIAPPEKNEEEFKPYWEIFKKVLDTVQGEQNFDLALRFHQFILEEMGHGVAWEKALLHVGRCYAVGGDPRLTAYPSGDEKTVPSAIETDEENEIINFGGIRLDRRN